MQIYPLSTGFGLSFLLEDSRGLYLVDSGSPGQQDVVLQKMRELGRNDLKLIWITHAHYDHYGSAAALREITGAPIGTHPAAAPYLAQGKSPLGEAHGRGVFLPVALAILSCFKSLPKTPPDFLREDGQSLIDFGLEATVLYTPGHTPGHTCLLLADGTAFAADLIARNPRTRLQNLLATDWGSLPASLARLQAAHPRRIYTGHSKRPLTGEELQQLK